MHGDCFQRCGLHRIGGGVAVPTQGWGGCVFKSSGLQLNYLRIVSPCWNAVCAHKCCCAVVRVGVLLSPEQNVQ